MVWQGAKPVSTKGIIMQVSTRGLAANTVLVVTPAGKKYNPSAASAQNNAQSWGTVQAAIKAGKGTATMGALQLLCATQHNHSPFVGYAIRRGWLAVKAAK